MSAGEFIYHGDLAKTPLPEILATIHRYGVPGVLEFKREEESRKLYFIGGDVIFASSSDRADSLGDFLLKQGRITESQLQVSVMELKRSTGQRHGNILVQMGFLKAEELGSVVREQVQSILWSLFNWDQAVVSFTVGRFKDDEVYKIKIPTPRAILSGCKHIKDVKPVMARLGSRSTVFRRREMPEHLENLQLDSSERSLLQMIDGKQTLFEICEAGPLSAGVNARILDAFMHLQLIEKVDLKTPGIRIKAKG